MPKRRWDDGDSTSDAPPWDGGEPHPSEGERQLAGERLVERWLLHYCEGKLTAKDVCINCWWASAAGAEGPFDKFKVKPEASSGNFQKKLDKAFAFVRSMEPVSVPAPQFIKGERDVAPLLLVPPHEAFAAEYLQDGDLRDRLNDGLQGDPEWADAYNRHPAVAAAGGCPVHPVALYVDGVRYTKAIGLGRSDTFIGFFTYSLITAKRHLLGLVRKSRLCRCGCRGWCTLWTVFRFLRWSFGAAMEAKRPSTMWNGEEWPADSYYGSLLAVGRDLPCRVALAQIKGDWAEYCSTFGFPTWSSKHCPCFLCQTDKEHMYDFGGVSLGQHRWGGHSLTSYSDACERCEVDVGIDSEGDRMLLLSHMQWKHVAKPDGGRTVKDPLTAFGTTRVDLCRNDRLEPSDALPDIGKLREAPLPVTLTFWRRRKLGTANLDPVLRRNPLLDNRLIGDPRSVFRIDTLHTLYLGVYQNFVQVCMWRVIDVNPWKIVGPRSYIIEQGFKLLRLSLFRYYDDADIELSYRLNALTPKMFGETGPTGTCHTKAAETGPLVKWAHQLILKYETMGGTYLRAAGYALVRHATIIRNSPMRMNRADSLQLLETFHVYVRNWRAAGARFLPKHHLWAHLVLLTQANGNPRFYNTFLDETLNGVVGHVARASHQLTWERSIFKRLQLMPLVGGIKYFSCI